MRFKDVFSIIGPPMIGPSSSHTAGAARIGRAARQLLGGPPDEAVIVLYGSFAATYQGHGTDTALVGGLLDFGTDDPRLPDALKLAEQTGLRVSFEQGKGVFPHPNTARVLLQSADDGRKLILVGTSIGGGNVEVVEMNGFAVRFSCMYPTLVVRHDDRPGIIAEVTGLLKEEGVNIGHMSLDRTGRNGDALAVLELDSPISARLLGDVRGIPFVRQVNKLDLTAH